MKVCVVVPHYDHVEQFRQMLPSLVRQQLPIILVDDASPDAVVAALQLLLREAAPDAVLVRRDRNGGKGAAVSTGLKAALEAGYTHALQIDADGQHDILAVPQFVAAGERLPGTLVCGRPRFDGSISPLRYYGRFLTQFLCWLETLSREIKDPMCGFRLYPLAETLSVLPRGHDSARMSFDPELLVRAVWAGIPLCYIDVQVRYPEHGRSHFHYLRDNAEITWMHVRLLFGMLLRAPALLARKPGHGK